MRRKLHKKLHLGGKNLWPDEDEKAKEIKEPPKDKMMRGSTKAK